MLSKLIEAPKLLTYLYFQALKSILNVDSSL